MAQHERIRSDEPTESIDEIHERVSAAAETERPVSENSGPYGHLNNAELKVLAKTFRNNGNLDAAERYEAEIERREIGASEDK